MSEVLKQAAQQTPSLVVLVVVVWMFLRFMDQISARFASEMSALHKDHLDAREQARLALISNSEALSELTKVVAVLKEK